jgi:hypothetical protein
LRRLHKHAQAMIEDDARKRKREEEREREAERERQERERRRQEDEAAARPAVVVRSRIERPSPSVSPSASGRAAASHGGVDRLLRTAITSAAQSTSRPSPTRASKRTRDDDSHHGGENEDEDDNGVDGAGLTTARVTELLTRRPRIAADDSARAYPTAAAAAAPAVAGDAMDDDGAMDLRALLGPRSGSRVRGGANHDGEDGVRTQTGAGGRGRAPSALAAATVVPQQWAPPALLPPVRSRLARLGPPPAPLLAFAGTPQTTLVAAAPLDTSTDPLDVAAAATPAGAEEVGATRAPSDQVRCKYYPKCLNPTCTFFHDPALVPGQRRQRHACAPSQRWLTGIMRRVGGAAALKKDASTVLCKYGRACKRPDCAFKHPAAHASPRGSKNRTLNLTTSTDGTDATGAAAAAAEASAPAPTTSTSTTPVCRYGARCTNPQCRYQHPRGRAGRHNKTLILGTVDAAEESTPTPAAVSTPAADAPTAAAV